MIGAAGTEVDHGCRMPEFDAGRLDPRQWARYHPPTVSREEPDLHSLCTFALIASIACALPAAAQEPEPPKSPSDAPSSAPSAPTDAGPVVPPPGSSTPPVATTDAAPAVVETQPTSPATDAASAAPPDTAASPTPFAPLSEPHAVPPLKMTMSIAPDLPMSMLPEERRMRTCWN